MDNSNSGSRHLNLLPVCISSRDKRSVSPLTPTSSQRLSGVHIFKVISNRLTRHRARHQSHSPSSDSESSSSSSNEEHQTNAEHRASRANNNANNVSSYRNEVSNSGGDQNSNSGSDSGSGSSGSSSSSSGQTSSNNTSDSGRLSIKGVFKRLSINGRSQSAGRKPRAKKAPKKILRAPVVSTFVKGISGLPTQRVPRGYPCPCVFIPHQDSLFGLNR